MIIPSLKTNIRHGKHSLPFHTIRSKEYVSMRNRLWKICTAGILCVSLLFCSASVLFPHACTQAEESSLTSSVAQQQMVFALAVGNKNDDSQQSKDYNAAMLALFPLLTARDNLTVSLYNLFNNRLITPELALYDSAENQQTLWNELAAVQHMKTNNRSADFSEFAANMSEYSTKWKDDTELWIVDGRSPIGIDIDNNNGFKKASDIFITLLEEHPAFKIHFIYFTKPNLSQGEQLISDYIASKVKNGTSRVFQHQLDSTLPPFDLSIAANQIAFENASSSWLIGEAPSPAIPIDTTDASAKTWKFTYDHMPWNEASDTLLLLTHNSKPESIQIIPKLAHSPEASATESTPSPIPNDSPAPILEPSGTPESTILSTDTATPATIIPTFTPTLSAFVTPTVPSDINAADSHVQTTPLKSIQFSTPKISWLFLRNLPVGQYEMIVQYAKATAPALQLKPHFKATLGQIWLEDKDCKPLINGLQWQRDSRPLRLVMENVPADQSNQWEPKLLVNSNAVEGIEFSKVENESNTSFCTFEIPQRVLVGTSVILQPMVTHATQPFVVLEGKPVTVQLENRVPLLKPEAQTEYRIFHHNINQSNTNEPPAQTETSQISPEGKPFTIDLNSIVSDPDADALCFAISNCLYTTGGVQKTLPKNIDEHFTCNDFDLTINDQTQLLFTPLSGDFDIELTLTATEMNAPNNPVTFTLMLHQESLSTLLNDLKIVMANKSLQALRANEWQGILGKPTELSFRIDNAAKIIPLFNEARKQLPDLPELAFQIPYTISTEVVGSKTQGDSAAPSQPLQAVAKLLEDGNIGFDIILPRKLKFTTYKVVFDCSNTNYQGIPLPQLLSKQPYTVIINNTAPTATNALNNVTSFHDELDGPPWKINPMSLKDIAGLHDISMEKLFSDTETPDSLQYSIKITPMQNVIVPCSHEVLTTQDGWIPLCKDKNGFHPLDISFQACGDYRIEFKATDEEKSTSFQINVSLSSSFLRITAYIAIALGALLLLTFLVLLIRYLRLPQFKDLSVAIHVSDCDTTNPNFSRMLPLHTYRKNAVSLLALVMALQEPLLDELDASTLRDVLLKPSRKGYCELCSGKIAQSHLLHRVNVSTSALDSPMMVTSDTFMLCAKQNQNETIILMFRKENNTF